MLFNVMAGEHTWIHTYIHTYIHTCPHTIYPALPHTIYPSLPYNILLNYQRCNLLQIMLFNVMAGKDIHTSVPYTLRSHINLLSHPLFSQLPFLCPTSLPFLSFHFNTTTERAQKLAKQRALAFTDRGERGRGDDEDEEVDLLLIEVCEAMLGDDKRGLLAASSNLTITLLGLSS